MSSHKSVKRARANYYQKRMADVPLPGDPKCHNCGQVFTHRDRGHFVPPSFGEPGFFACEKKETNS